MNCHQILSGACNAGDRCFAVGSVEGVPFTVSIPFVRLFIRVPSSSSCYSGVRGWMQHRHIGQHVRTSADHTWRDTQLHSHQLSGLFDRHGQDSRCLRQSDLCVRTDSACLQEFASCKSSFHC